MSNVPTNECCTFIFEGVGVHSGKRCRVKLRHRTASADSKVVFIRQEKELPATAQYLYKHNRRATTITSATTDFRVGTVEHLLFATLFFGENWRVEIDGPEVPILDGSAQPFIEAFLKAGIPQNQHFFSIPSPIQISSDKSHVEILPCEEDDTPVYSVKLTYPPPIGAMSFSYSPAASNFALALAPARTFALESEISLLRDARLGLGGSLDCALIFGDDGPLNSSGLRFPDEPARHKMLDFIGDMALLESLPWAHISVYRPGHHLNHAIVKYFMDLKR